jgi:hypothetical protein
MMKGREETNTHHLDDDTKVRKASSTGDGGWLRKKKLAELETPAESLCSRLGQQRVLARS